MWVQTSRPEPDRSLIHHRGTEGGDTLKAYVMTSGLIFGLITLAHVWRVFEEGTRLAKDPGYVLLTLAAAALCLWAWRLLRTLGRA